LSNAAIAFRAFHAGITVTFLSAIALVWWSALTGRRGRLLKPAVAGLLGEGAVVALNHGDCPLGGTQKRLGDQTPLFELVLSPRAARMAVPALGLFTGAGIVALVVRGPSRSEHG
jgi:hypothetical protein